MELFKIVLLYFPVIYNLTSDLQSNNKLSIMTYKNTVIETK